MVNNMLTNLPSLILTEILLQCDIESISNCLVMINKQLWQLCNNNLFWKLKIINDFNSIPNKLNIIKDVNQVNWKAEYITCYYSSLLQTSFCLHSNDYIPNDFTHYSSFRDFSLMFSDPFIENID